MSENVLELRNITKSFDGVEVLHKVSFSVQPGEVHALLGENGAGKSTLVKVMTGVYQPIGSHLEHTMKCVGFQFKVRSDRLAEYKEHHKHVWPEMLDALRETGWHNYSLFMRADGLIFGISKLKKAWL